MIITYHGAHFFKIQFGDTTIAYNPVSKESKFKQVRFGADMVLVSLRHKDMNGVDAVSYGEKKPFPVLGPGEYEIKDVFIKGWPSLSSYDGKEGSVNTVYSVLLEGMNLLFIGELSAEKDLPKELAESTESVDILFLPVGGKGLLTPEEASKVALKLEPKIIIPMNIEDDDASLKKFLKEVGEDGARKEDKLTLKKKDLDGKDGEVMMLSAS